MLAGEQHALAKLHPEYWVLLMAEEQGSVGTKLPFRLVYKQSIVELVEYVDSCLSQRGESRVYTFTKC